MEEFSSVVKFMFSDRRKARFGMAYVAVILLGQ